MKANIKHYLAETIEPKWSKKWIADKIYKAKDNDFTRQKAYILIEFPYPSGERLHVGHARSYSCLDAVARMKRMQGYNVMFPFGWDAFGLPAENYAIKTGIHPQITTKENIINSKKQAIAWGLSFDWDREINTTDSNYYKWTQWIFVKMFKEGLAYKNKIAVNWCPSCKIILANEEVIEGKCERCGEITERRKQSQWMLKITKYADRLLEDLKMVNYREDIAAQQVNWIGKKEGANVRFKLDVTNGQAKFLDVFTTRIDTLFGVTYMAVAPEAMEELMKYVKVKLSSQVERYISEAMNKSERERKIKAEKTGVDTGLKVINPATGKKIPVWVADYVMMDIGTGVVMGVPAHDQRDWDFAKKMGINIVEVIKGGSVNEAAYTGGGVLVNSEKYNGEDWKVAGKKMIDDGLGKITFHYHLRDWVFSRQHYWGEPIPMIECEKCGWVPVPEEQLPVELPLLDKFQPIGTGDSPLAGVDSFVNTICPKCRGKAKRETDTMPNWAGSSWYFLRYCDVNNSKVLADQEKLKYWLPVDWYNGGMEHTTLHLLYSRFWYKFLYDIGVVPTAEPYIRRTSHGVVLGPDSRKMSKSRGNVINPDEVVAKFGADTLRLYEMFIGPFDQMVSWSWEGVEGTHRFLKRVWNLCQEDKGKEEIDSLAVQMLSRLSKRVETDFEAMKFNTAVAGMMEFVNWWNDHKELVGKQAKIWFLKLLAPMAPFIAEELYQRLSKKTDSDVSIHLQDWPRYKIEDLEESQVTVMVQVDGKVRGRLMQQKTETGESTQKAAMEIENVAKYITGDFKVVYVPGKIINFITK